MHAVSAGKWRIPCGHEGEILIQYEVLLPWHCCLSRNVDPARGYGCAIFCESNAGGDLIGIGHSKL